MKALTIYQKDYPEYFSKLAKVIGNQGEKYSLAAVINPKRQEVVICRTEKDRDNWKEVDVYKCLISVFKSKVRRSLYITTDFNTMGVSSMLKIQDKTIEIETKNEVLSDLNMVLDLWAFTSQKN